VQEVLVNRRQFLTKRFVQVLDDFRVSTHPFPPQQVSGVRFQEVSGWYLDHAWNLIPDTWS